MRLYTQFFLVPICVRLEQDLLPQNLNLGENTQDLNRACACWSSSNKSTSPSQRLVQPRCARRDQSHIRSSTESGTFLGRSYMTCVLLCATRLGHCTSRRCMISRENKGTITPTKFVEESFDTRYLPQVRFQSSKTTRVVSGGVGIDAWRYGM